MKRAIITACATLAAAPLCAQESSVTIYGIADASVRYASGQDGSYRPAPGSALSVGSGLNNTSRFGFRGQESFGNGYGALFQLEGGINFDTGTNARSDKFFDRLAFVGFSTPVGTVTAGRHATLLADAISPVDPLGMRFASYNPNINVTALSNTAYGGGSFGKQFGTSGANDNYYRTDNSLKYTGQFGGLTARAWYSAGEVVNDRSALSSTGLGLAWAGGPLAVSGAAMKFKDPAGLSLDAWTLGAAYTAGAFTFKGNYGSNTGANTATTETKQNIASAGVSWAPSAQWLLTVAHYDVKRTRTGRADDGFGRSFAFLEYNLSKRTRLYLEGDRTHWKAGSEGLTGTAANKATSTALSVGVMHLF